MGSWAADATSSMPMPSSSPKAKPKKRMSYEPSFKVMVVKAALQRPPQNRIKPTCALYPGIEPCQLRKWIRNYESQALATMENQSLSRVLPQGKPAKRASPSSRGANGTSGHSPKRPRKTSVPLPQVVASRSAPQRAAAAHRRSFAIDDDEEDEEEDEDVSGEEGNEEDEAEDDAEHEPADDAFLDERAALRCDSTSTLASSEIELELTASADEGSRGPDVGAVTGALQSIERGDASELRTPTHAPLRLPNTTPEGGFALAASLPSAAASLPSAMPQADPRLAPAPSPSNAPAMAPGYATQPAGADFSAMGLCPQAASGHGSSSPFLGSAMMFPTISSAVDKLQAWDAQGYMFGQSARGVAAHAQDQLPMPGHFAHALAYDRHGYAMLAQAYYRQQQLLGHAALLPGHFGRPAAPQGEWAETSEQADMTDTSGEAWVNEWLLDMAMNDHV